MSIVIEAICKLIFTVITALLVLSALMYIIYGPPGSTPQLQKEYIIKKESFIECGNYEIRFECPFISLEVDEDIYKVVCENKVLAMVPKALCIVTFKNVKE